MQERPAAKAASKQIWPTIYFVGFFVVFYLYVWLWIDPSLFYHGVGMIWFPVFSWGQSFLYGHLFHPGGPIEYLAALLSQLYYYPWAGALILTAVAALLGMATSSLITAVVGVRVALVRFIPGLFVLAICQQYLHRLSIFLALLVALLAACVYTRTAGRSGALRLAVFLVLSGPLYYLASGAYLLYAVLCGILELRSKQGRLLGLSYLMFAEAVPYAFGIFAFDLRLVDAYTRLTPFYQGAESRGQVTVTALYLFPLLAVVAAALWQRRAVGTEAMPPAARPARLRRLTKGWRNLKAKPGFGLVLVLVAFVAVILVSLGSSTRAMMRIHRFAGEKMWREVLTEAQGLRHARRYAYGSMHTVTRALYETGRLPDEMFCYPQRRGGFMLGWGLNDSNPGDFLYAMRMQSFFELGDVTLQLGMVNEAEHEAHESLEFLGDYPQILKRLALIKIIKGQTEAAKVLLRALGRYMYYGRWAQEALRRLEADPLWSKDPEVQRIRSVMVTDESAVLRLFLESRFDQLLRRNRHNRMAFEYRMAFYLLKRDLEKLVSELDRLDDFDYPGIPRHYEEAILVYERLSGDRVDLHGRQISAETRQAYREFREVKMGAWEELGDRFGDTYFLYHLFGEAGVTAE